MYDQRDHDKWLYILIVPPSHRLGIHSSMGILPPFGIYMIMSVSMVLIIVYLKIDKHDKYCTFWYTQFHSVLYTIVIILYL